MRSHAAARARKSLSSRSSRRPGGFLARVTRHRHSVLENHAATIVICMPSVSLPYRHGRENSNSKHPAWPEGRSFRDDFGVSVAARRDTR